MSHSPPPTPTPDLAKKWAPHERAQAYREVRFATRRKQQRDLHLLDKLVRRHDPLQRWPRVLDAPCGTGRLQPYLQERSDKIVSLDVSAAMLGEHPPGHRLQGSNLALPFADRTFDAVVCCRLFHHLRDDDQRRSLLRELLRVTQGPAYLSFWDAATWHAWRRRRGWRKVTNQDGRVAIGRGRLEQLLQQEGAKAMGYAHSLRGISQQAWVAVQGLSQA